MNAVRAVSAFLASILNLFMVPLLFMVFKDRMQLMLERSPVWRYQYRGHIPVICTDVLLLNVKWLGWNAASPSLSAVAAHWLRQCVTDQIGGSSLKMSARTIYNFCTVLYVLLLMCPLTRVHNYCVPMTIGKSYTLLKSRLLSGRVPIIQPVF